MIDNAGNVRRDSEIADPHHEGTSRWKWDGGKLYHNTHGTKRWVEVKRIHPTPARIKALASILNHQPAPVMDDARGNGGKAASYLYPVRRGGAGMTWPASPVRRGVQS